MRPLSPISTIALGPVSFANASSVGDFCLHDISFLQIFVQHNKIGATSGDIVFAGVVCGASVCAKMEFSHVCLYVADVDMRMLQFEAEHTLI